MKDLSLSLDEIQTRLSERSGSGLVQLASDDYSWCFVEHYGLHQNSSFWSQSERRHIPGEALAALEKLNLPLQKRHKAEARIKRLQTIVGSKLDSGTG
jgi:hypothetical protein